MCCDFHGPWVLLLSWVFFSIKKFLKVISYSCVSIKTNIIQAGFVIIYLLIIYSLSP